MRRFPLLSTNWKAVDELEGCRRTGRWNHDRHPTARRVAGDRGGSARRLQPVDGGAGDSGGTRSGRGFGTRPATCPRPQPAGGAAPTGSRTRADRRRSGGGRTRPAQSVDAGAGTGGRGTPSAGGLPRHRAKPRLGRNCSGAHPCGSAIRLRPQRRRPPATQRDGTAAARHTAPVAHCGAGSRRGIAGLLPRSRSGHRCRLELPGRHQPD